MELATLHPTLLTPAKNCPLCPRLAEFRKQNQQFYPDYYNGAVPAFGGLDAQLLIVGLAPGLHGANATGRPFTGDFAGDVLYPALVRVGFAKSSEFRVQSPENSKQSDVFRAKGNQTELWTLNSGLLLQNARITNAVRCVPPENKPLPGEIKTCNVFLRDEIATMPHLKVVLTLGLVSHKAVLTALGLKQSAFGFGHGNAHRIQSSEFRVQKKMSLNSELWILNSYHTSRYNMNTGRLTETMFDEVIKRAAELVS
jgi:uracil-DNA glycosylase